MILGIDEVGRGPWAGPLVVGAVVLPEAAEFEGLTDSKKVTAENRVLLDTQIRNKAVAWGLGWVHADELDKIGLSAALKLATIRAVEQIAVPYHQIIIDGTINFLKDTSKGKYVTTLPKADALIPAVSAASIIAKVARDSFMEAQAKLYPEYGFDTHVGYGTARHTAALKAHGVTPMHRRSFSPIAKLLNESLPEVPKQDVSMSTKSIGDTAESTVAQFLENKGHTIIERNWRTKQCEIDIISTYNDTIYFTEVKYRSSLNQGGGEAAITQAKLKQMTFAAELYLTRKKLQNAAKLLGASVDHDQIVGLFEIE